MSVYYNDDSVTLHLGDALDVVSTLPGASVDCVVTSPPYFGLRDYGEDGQYGAEATPHEYVSTMVRLFRECRRVLAQDGTFWLNLGDGYAGQGQSHSPASSALSAHDGQSPSYPSDPNGSLQREHCSSSSSIGPLSTMKQGARNGNRRSRPRGYQGFQPKSLLGVPWRVALALQDDGWILRNEVVWSKSNAMPDPQRDRLERRHEHLFMFTQTTDYFFDKQPGRNESGDVWDIPTQPFPGAHFATFPKELPRRAIVSGCKPGGVVLDPFNGSGTTGLVAQENGRRYVGVDISEEYLKLTLDTRLQNGVLDLT